MKNKLVTVIIPTYNRANLIKETINSVLNQTHQNFEILIIDDGSVDNTKAVVQSIKDDRIKYYWQEHSGLPAIARNKGLNIAKGEFIAFLDSDDIWFPQKLEKQIEIIEKNPDILLISTNGITFPSKYPFMFLSIKEDKRISFRLLLKGNFVKNSSVLMKKSVIDAIGLLDENFQLKAMEDYDYWLRLLKYKDKSILILKEILIKYRIHEDSVREYSLFKDPKYHLNRYKTYLFIFNKYKDHDQNYIKAQLKPKLYKFWISKMEHLLLQKKICQLDLLRNKYIKSIKKVSILLKYYNRKYFKFIKLLDCNLPHYCGISFFKMSIILRNYRLYILIEK